MTSLTNKKSPKPTPSIRNGIAAGVLVAALSLTGAGVAIADNGGIGSGGDGDGGGSDTSGGGGGDSKYEREWKSFPRKDKRWAKKTSECESGGDPRIHGSGGLYHGAFQFHADTWRTSPMSPGGKHADRYSWTTQAVVAVKLKRRDGAGHWPVCG